MEGEPDKHWTLHQRRIAVIAGGHWARLERLEKGILEVLWCFADFQQATVEVSNSTLCELAGDRNENRVRKALHELYGLGIIRPRPDLMPRRRAKVYECLAPVPLPGSRLWKKECGIPTSPLADALLTALPEGDPASPPQRAHGGPRKSPMMGDPACPPQSARGTARVPLGGGPRKSPSSYGGGGESTTTSGISMPPPRRRQLTADENKFHELLMKRGVWKEPAEDYILLGLTASEAEAIWKQVEREYNGDGFHAFHPRQRNIRNKGSVFNARLKNSLERKLHAPTQNPQ